MLKNRHEDRSFAAEDIKSQFRHYTELDPAAVFNGWEEIEVFIADDLVDAWIEARPDEAGKFNDPTFREMVSNSSGKWLEKRFAQDSYKVILATRDATQIEITARLAHEIRHCLDYQNAVVDLPFDDYRPGDRYFNNLSEFRAVMAATRCHFFLTKLSDADNFCAIDYLFMRYGLLACDSVEGILNCRMQYDPDGILYYISRFLGASRAIRNLSEECNLHARSLQLWTMMPTYIVEKFGYVFYLANEWESIDNCRLDNPKVGVYYKELIRKIQQIVSE